MKILGELMETTLNIHTDILEQIAKAAQSNHISRSEMILFLIKKVARDISNPGRIGRLVQYQDKARPEDWRVFHVKVREDMYEYWLDLRKLLKMSVSLILAHAVKRYLDKPMKVDRTDNNLCKNYIILKEVIDSVIIWKFVWGFPPNLKKLFNI
jgi:hypothetical protein